MAQRLTSRSKIKAPKASKPKKEKKQKAARVSPQQLSDAIGSNVTDSAIKSHLVTASSLKADVDSAMGAFRAQVKKCKEIGLDPADVSWYLSTKKREPEDVDAETRRRNRIAQVMRLPLGTQLGLFNDGKGKPQTVATRIENDEGVKERTVAATRRTSMEALDKAQEQGKIAGDMDLTRGGNPHEEGSPEFIRWDYGWQEGAKARRDAQFEESKEA